MKQRRKRTQLNNAGFSLLEVLIAMIILALVSIPLLHSFVTTAKTNTRAKLMLRATDSAENMMETFKYQDLEMLTQRFSAEPGNTVVESDGSDGAGGYDAMKDGVILFSLKNEADFSAKLPKGYYMEVELNPNLYPNANSVNVADMNTISATNSAVYRMNSGFDAMVYEEFALLSEKAPAGQGYVQQDAAYFKENLDRSITITIQKKGTATDENGDDVTLVSVSCQIDYKLPKSITNVLPESQKEYSTGKKELFNNVASKIPLESVFVIYQPRYLANAAGTSKEIIRINNTDNIETNVYVVAQETTVDTAKRPQYYSSTTGPQVIVEELQTGSATADMDAKVTLFTNLCEKAPYTITDTAANGNMLCNLSYKSIAHTLGTGEEAMKLLDVRDLTGKRLNAEAGENRIYKMTVKVFDGVDTEPLVELDGTKIE